MNRNVQAGFFVHHKLIGLLKVAYMWKRSGFGNSKLVQFGNRLCNKYL